MSVLVKHMDMPDKCIECWNCDKNFVDKNLRSIDNWMCLVEMRFVLDVGTYARPEWCPLVEVPTPHGDLIDRNELAKTRHDIHVEEINYRHRCISLENLYEAKTVIESEEEDDE